MRNIQYISALWLYPFSSLLLLSSILLPLAGLDPKHPPITRRMQLTHTLGQRAQLPSGLHTGNSVPGQAGGGWVLTSCYDEQNLQHSILNPNIVPSLLHLYLKSVPYTLDHKLLPQIRFHIFVGHLKNCDLKQCDSGKNSKEPFLGISPNQNCFAQDSFCFQDFHSSQLQRPAFSFTIVILL